MKATFLNYEKPLLCAMIQATTPEKAIKKIKDSLADGAEALGIQLCKFKKEYRTKEILKEIFDACEGKPIYVTSYRHSESEGYTDDECAALLLLAVDAGATLCDVMGDMYARDTYYELTRNEEAIQKQKALIDEIHKRGGEVLMSSHTMKNISTGECEMIAKAHYERGADISKIVNTANTKSEIPQYIQAIQNIITQNPDKKLLLLVSGEGQIIRYIGPNFGVCMYLCVAYHGELDTPQQPVLKSLKQIRDNIRFDI
ncbi:MAG: type I 3-dehydroquinate dehydratase [Clostridia bacterium]|nr:type I 3-dehydroquinate dehydratase [Clostridia bacterium]